MKRKKAQRGYLVSLGNPLRPNPDFIVVSENIKSAYLAAERHLKRMGFFDLKIIRRNPCLDFEATSPTKITYVFYLVPMTLVR